jgi:hypothetical protein
MLGTFKINIIVKIYTSTLPGKRGLVDLKNINTPRIIQIRGSELLF